MKVLSRSAGGRNGRNYRFDRDAQNLDVRVLWWVCGVFLGLAIWVAGSAQAQSSSRSRRAFDERFRLRMDESVPSGKRAVFGYGGWFRSSFWDADDNVDRNGDGRDDGRHVLRRQQLRLWGDVNLDQVHHFYVRGRLDYLDWNSGTSFDGRDSDWDGPDLDRLWYEFKLSAAQRAYGWDSTDFDFTVRLGRQYVEMGTGLALSVPLDAVWMTCRSGDWRLSGLLGLSVSDAHNIDQSVPGDSEENRRYWGVQVNYDRWRDHEIFAYYFAQDDGDAGKVLLGQTFGYDSQYVGVGSRGAFFSPQVQYTVEIVGEFGKSYAWTIQNEPPDRENIQAWAFDTELRYLMSDKNRTEWLVEYLLASGDTDRYFSPTNTVGGNRPHSKDRGFSGWGFRNTGMVLVPEISNLGMARVGVSTFPVPDNVLWRRFQVGTDLFVYHKQNRDGAMSDSLSTDASAFVGLGLDFYANWRIVSDVAWTIRYGLFMPGDALVSETDRQQLFTGVTLSF